MVTLRTIQTPPKARLYGNDPVAKGVITTRSAFAFDFAFRKGVLESVDGAVNGRNRVTVFDHRKLGPAQVERRDDVGVAVRVLFAGAGDEGVNCRRLVAKFFGLRKSKTHRSILNRWNKEGRDDEGNQDRRQNRIQTVHHTTVTRQPRTHVFHAEVSLDERLRKVAKHRSNEDASADQ